MSTAIEALGLVMLGVCSVKGPSCTAPVTAAPITAVWEVTSRKQINVCRACFKQKTVEGEWKDAMVRLVGEVERLRTEAKCADKEATMMANSDLATTEQVIRALRAEVATHVARARADAHHAQALRSALCVARAALVDPIRLTLPQIDAALTAHAAHLKAGEDK